MIIEIRPIIEKRMLKRRIRTLRKELRLRKTHKVPHLTLIYDFTSEMSPSNIAKIVRDTALKYPNMSFDYSGWKLKKGESGYVFSFKIEPNQQLREFRYDLYNNLKNNIQDNSSFNKLSSDDYWFHSAISFKMDENTANRVRTFIENKHTSSILNELLPFIFGKKRRNNISPVFLKGEVTRIPIIRRNRITYEYDILLDKILSRNEALSKYYTKMTFKKYRETNNMEVELPSNRKNKTIWLISDTHFEHGNVIDFCGRPFYDTEEMNSILVSNWNNTVSSSNTIYHLGDVALSRERTYPKRSVTHITEKWVKRLNGNKIFINGNHDPEDFGEKSKIIEYKGFKFLLIHDPKGVKDFDGWIIHGHTHNNNLIDYPFINFEKKTINVSVELIQYAPIDLDEIIDILNSNKSKENILYYNRMNTKPKIKEDVVEVTTLAVKGNTRSTLVNEQEARRGLILLKCICQKCGNEWEIQISRYWTTVNCKCKKCENTWVVTNRHRVAYLKRKAIRQADFDDDVQQGNIILRKRRQHRPRRGWFGR